ncbi:MAG: hypothetical protein FWB76_06900 [Oscillospiraceae bacterium]|nr:hypothetical protein [Oscillospiraceae bacterium]
MGWSLAGQIVLLAVASAGGIGSIVVAVIKFGGKMIAKRIDERYKIELAAHKSELQRKVYISQKRFDTEFQIFRELSSAFFLLRKNVQRLTQRNQVMVPSDKESEIEQEKQWCLAALKAYVDAQDVLNANASFIKAEFFEQYKVALALADHQLTSFEKHYQLNAPTNVWNPGRPESVKILTPEVLAKEDALNAALDKLNDDVRTYLASLDVIE